MTADIFSMLKNSPHFPLSRAVHLSIEARISPAEPKERLIQIYYCISIALGISETESAVYATAMAFHDVGMQMIPESLIAKKDGLTQRDRDILRDHTLNGRDLLVSVGDDFTRCAAELALLHHERNDGSGYPYGLCGDSLPVCAKIAAAADCLSAMTSDRFYRKALLPDEAISSVIDDKTLDDSVKSAVLSRKDEILTLFL